MSDISPLLFVFVFGWKVIDANLLSALFFLERHDEFPALVN